MTQKHTTAPLVARPTTAPFASLNLIEQGLALQAASIPMHARNVIRDVKGHELFNDVFLEAIEQGCFVWTDGKRTVIASEQPFGKFVKVDSAFIQQFHPDAA